MRCTPSNWNTPPILKHPREVEAEEVVQAVQGAVQARDTAVGGGGVKRIGDTVVNAPSVPDNQHIGGIQAEVSSLNPDAGGETVSVRIR